MRDGCSSHEEKGRCIPGRDKFQQRNPGMRKCVVCSGKGHEMWLKCRAGRREEFRRRQTGRGFQCLPRELRLHPEVDGDACRLRSRGNMWSGVGSRKITVVGAENG